ncbi:hypothetical protein DL768_006633 [Monosporascus sp. mg162]|nr:hypothetical protein DL768_006633 [Monosporascus sp. mg162]
MWQRVLKATGFSGLDATVWDCEDEERQASSGIMSTAVQQHLPVHDDKILPVLNGMLQSTMFWLANLLLPLASLEACLETLSLPERGGKLLVPRLRRDDAENRSFANTASDSELQLFMQPEGRLLKIEVMVPGRLDSMVFRDDEDVEKVLPDGWVEIEPRAYGLNFRDVMGAMGQLDEAQQLGSNRIFSSRDASFAPAVLLATGQHRLDAVINSLAGSLLHESCEVLALHGRFVEIGKRDIHRNMALEMGSFRKVTSFTAVDLVQLADHRGRIMQRVLAEVIALLGSRIIRNIAPVVMYTMAEIGQALRLMQAGKHIGKLGIVPEPGDLVKASSPQKSAKFEQDATISSLED